MFKLPNFPSPEASGDELADFAEVVAWQKGFASSTDLVRYLSVADDNVDISGEIYQGCEDQEDSHLETLESVFELLNERLRICGASYPFELDPKGSVLKLREIGPESTQELYLYLLGATRLNMKTHKILAGVDGTLLMEEVSLEAIRHYLGSARAMVMVFGTASTGGFQQRLTNLISQIKEPCRFENIDGDDAPIKAQDDGVDVVGWIPFADEAPGKLSIFAQVKTGTNWRDSTRECQPETFLRKWTNNNFTVPPVRAFCVAESIRRAGDWNSINVDAGVFFDRCRIVSCIDSSGFNRIAKLQNWVGAAKKLISDMLRGYN